MQSKVLKLSKLITTPERSLLSGVVLCFGHFNSIHPGHLRHFQTARNLGELLVVAIEGDKDLLDIERAQYFNEEDRAQSVAALSLVDHVVILDEGTLNELVDNLDVQTLVLGKEYEGLRAKKVQCAVEIATKKGAKIVYDAGETQYSDARLLSNSLTQLEQENWDQFESAQKMQGVNASQVFQKMQIDSRPKILVLGDTIVDRYVACDPIGMSNEAPVVVVKEIENKDYIGGAGIVASHVASLGADCTYLSAVGEDDNGDFVNRVLTEVGVQPILVLDATRPTTFKVRYMVENQKLFRVSRLKEHSVSSKIEQKIINRLEETASHWDAIVVCDFVYGVVTSKILRKVQEIAKIHSIPLYGDLQCSSQIGSILKFSNFGLLCPTEKEARIALGNQDDGVEYLANLLIDRTRCKNLVLKMGGAGFIAYEVNDQAREIARRQHFPALMANPVDVTGAGDALLAAMAVSGAKGCSLMEAATFSTCVSGLAVQTLGNRPVSLENVRRFYAEMSSKRRSNGQ